MTDFVSLRRDSGGQWLRLSLGMSATSGKAPVEPIGQGSPIASRNSIEACDEGASRMIRGSTGALQDVAD
jgi:hypothetical protein